MRILVLAALVFCWLPVWAQTLAPSVPVDTDRDGLSDAVEDALLAQFAPHFLVSDDDCSVMPAQFVPFADRPEIEKENGTIYGEAFPREGHAGQVELHYYHLWRRDCGEMNHALDAEHVSALVTGDGGAGWKALYWYAAAHENTLCDASQIARAATVDGELHGPAVWISRGKHASFLNPAICTHGCGGDQCRATTPLPGAPLINLGEESNAMNGATWAGSAEWRLAYKMSHADLTDARMARVDRLPATSIAWANPENRPMQAAILGGNGAVVGASTGLRATDTALDLANSNTGRALDSASGSTGRGLARSGRGIMKALRATARKLGMVE